MTEDELTDLLLEHSPGQGVMVSWTHWAYQAAPEGGAHLARVILEAPGG